MRAPKLLCVASAVDLDFRYGCTPAWWQLWKGLHEEGAELVVAPYRGRPIETPWWRAAPNPAYARGRVVRAGCATLVARLKGDRYLRRGEDVAERLARRPASRARRSGASSRRAGAATSSASSSGSGPTRSSSSPCRWRTSAASRARCASRFGIPVVFYDGDVPMSLPEFGGMDTGFNYYHGADPGEYDLVDLELRGRRRVAARARRPPRRDGLLGRRPRLLRARSRSTKETDVFFYGYGDKFRREWMAALVGEPSRALARASTSPSAATTSAATPGRPRLLGDIPFPSFPRAISAARINLCLTRRPHASVYASSSCRPFELAAAGAAIVANPYDGIERWFEPGSGAVIVVADADEAIAAYRALLDDPAQAEEMGRRARERVLDEHTYRHRARRLLELLGLEGRARMSTELEVSVAAPLPRRRAARRRAPDRDRPGATTRSGTSARLLDELRAARPRARGRRRLRRLDRPHRRGRRRGRCPRRPAAVQPRDRRGGADRVPLRVGARLRARGPARRRRPARPGASCARSSRPSSRARPTSRSARGSSAAAATAPRPRAASASACSRGSSPGSPASG